MTGISTSKSISEYPSPNSCDVSACPQPAASHISPSAVNIFRLTGNGVLGVLMSGLSYYYIHT